MDHPLRELSDEDLARQSQAGSIEAFEQLVFRYERRIFSFVAHTSVGATDAQEITQDTFVRAFRAIARFDSRLPFAPWLFTIARRRCIDHHRSAAPLSDETLPDMVDPHDPSELLARREDGQVLWQLARSSLSQAQFEALWLRYAEDMSIAEIAQVLRKTQTHVKVLLFRARHNLVVELSKQELAAEPAHGHTSPTLRTYSL